MKNINENKNIIEILNPREKNDLILIRKILRKLKFIFTERRLTKKKGLQEMDWSLMAKKFGSYSVIDSRHGPKDYAYVTKKQKEIIFPYLKKLIRKEDKILLDYGCGPGRFTNDLAGIINGHALGFDPTIEFINMCPKNKKTFFTHDFNHFKEKQIKFDVIWICLVLGGVNNEQLEQISLQIEKILGENGLLFFAESTSNKYIEGRWRIRTFEAYKDLFQFVSVKQIGKYFDAGQEISIMSGRRVSK